ncbi:MAG: glycosyltransferase family 2 protein [Spirochaetes bacterium]|nr:MAG: glycosyltransferase family 2 protein [Spirochaetota bacterium]
MSLVSVIIPTYNREGLILRALDSVLAQSFRDFDVWIIDDGGNDGSGELVRARAAENPGTAIRYVHTPNNGVAAARNHGIRYSEGDWIALLDSDDEWVPEKLEKQMAYLKRNPESVLIYSDELWIRSGVRVNPPKSYRKFGGEVFEKCLPVCMIGPSTALFKRNLFEETGGFDEEYPVCEDYDFWLRITSRYTAGLVDEPLTIKYGGHSDQLSTSYVAMDYWRIRSLCRIVDTRELSPNRRDAVLREIGRKGRILLQGYSKHDRKEMYEEVLTLIRSVDADFPPGI